MAALTPTASEVQIGTGAAAKFKGGTAGETITAGQPLYLKADGKYWLAQCDGSEAEADVQGLAVGGAAAEQKIYLQTEGPITYGATAALAAGDQIWLHSTAGSLTKTEADIVSTNYPTYIGSANASNQIVLNIAASGAVHA